MGGPVIDTVLFDLGGTLVRYYERSEFPPILRAAITRAAGCLPTHGRPAADMDAVWQRVAEEDREAGDYQVRPLEERLARIFGLGDPTGCGELVQEMCRGFMQPIYAIASLYDDALPALRLLKQQGYKTALVSNTPWGSPAHLWHEEVARHGLAEHLDATFFCRDAGWRKPARQVFEFVLERLDTRPERCLFVGDDPRWDVAGPAAVGISPVLLDRRSRRTVRCQMPHEAVTRIETLAMLCECRFGLVRRDG